jgi:UDP-2,3-diacylglucosamine pyrophosphatase LpxH
MSDNSTKILHLSDLHFGTSDQATRWSSQLVEDLKMNLHINKLDGLILSGDIANKSTSEEYQAARQFINKFLESFPLNQKQIIIVPGNHDIDWKLSKQAYTLKEQEECSHEELQADYWIPVCNNIVRVVNRQQYPQRFINFKQFYDRYKNSVKPYSLESAEQYSLDIIANNILILGLNSAWQLDNYFTDRASINNNALAKALEEIRQNNLYNKCLVKIAVWHHPIHSPYQDRIKEDAFLDRLAVNNFCLFIHGHVHKAETKEFLYDFNSNGRKLHQICAGTFGAPTKELNTGIPWQYNLLRFQDNGVRVDTRKRESEYGAWEGDYRWRHGKNETKSYYEIKLNNNGQ